MSLITGEFGELP